jgi:molybdate transport system permease protein
MIGTALWVSFKLAAITSFLLLFLGLPIARWIAFSRNRFKFLVESVIALPIILPPTVLGFYLLVALGPRSPIGALWTSWTGHTLAFSFAGLVVGSVIYSLPFAVQPFAASFASVDPVLLHASDTLGASRFRAFREIVLPLSMPGIITGFALSFAHTLGEFGVVLMIGGNIPAVTQTVSIAIYDHVEALEYSAANHAALLLLALSFVLLAFVYGINRKVLRVWPFE